MARVLTAEWLDRLPADDPRAIRSRRDLRVINGWMRQGAIMAAALRPLPPPQRLIDLGSGDGTFLLRVAQRLGWRDVTAHLVDQHDIVSAATRAAFEALDWRIDIIVADARDVLRRTANADLITANLFLHHLAADDLRDLFGEAAGAGASVVACEPRRNRLAALASRAVWALGCNAVSRHDAAASVRAGFTGRELSALWPARSWHLQEYAALPFTHCFVARRSVP
jgi:SAM-dependent methyltransferase